MANHIHIKSIKRKAIDEDKVALAFLLLAKILDEEQAPSIAAGFEGTDSEVA